MVNDNGDDDSETILAQMGEEDDEATVEFESFSGSEQEPRAFLVRLSDNVDIDMKGWSYSIGKDSTKSDYLVSDNKTVSRKHATIYLSNNQYYISDNNSTNGTFVNRQKVVSGRDHVLNDGDIIKLSNVEFRFHIFSK